MKLRFLGKSVYNKLLTVVRVGKQEKNEWSQSMKLRFLGKKDCSGQRSKAF